jgi:hypothetical protein
MRLALAALADGQPDPLAEPDAVSEPVHDPDAVPEPERFA